MLSLLRSLFAPPTPAGPTETFRSFGRADRPITAATLDPADDSWHFALGANETLRLYETTLDPADLGAGAWLLAYRAQLRAQSLDGSAYLQMWCGFDGRGEFFSKGLDRRISGTCGWTNFEAPFFLKRNQRPSRIKLEIQSEGKGGHLWVRNVALTKTPLKG